MIFGEVSQFVKWLETQGPLWVIYAMVMVGIMYLGRIVLKWLPTMFEKHCLMLDTATDSMSKSAQAIDSINIQVRSNRDRLSNGQAAIADAAVPACKAILVVTPPEKRQEIKEHLDEVVRILSKPIAKG
jgi:hypothetical protein